MTTYDFIAWLLPFLVVVIGQIYSWYDNRQKIATTNSKVEVVGHALNGRLAELIEATRAAAYAKGMADATKAERAVAAALAAPLPSRVRTEGEGAGHP